MAKHREKSNSVEATPKASRKDRSMRSTSPTKLPPPTPDTRPKASPKRRLKNKKEKKTTDGAKGRSRALHDHNEDGTPSVADSAAETEDPDPEDATLHKVADHAADAVIAQTSEARADALSAIAHDIHADGATKPSTKITIQSDEQDDGKVDAIHTKVTVEMPEGATEEVPESAEEAIAAAKAIVDEAKALQDTELDDGASAAKGKKRKAEDLEVENAEEEIVTELVNGQDQPPTVNGESSSADAKRKSVEFGERTTEPPVKRTRVMVPADEYRKQKMQKRAMLGVTATLAVG
ncbi:MAG: hypothetical protein Q9162_000274 [Coniocarpon cinnabarinum]